MSAAVTSSFPGFFGSSKCLEAASSRRFELRGLNVTYSINKAIRGDGDGDGLFDRKHEQTYLKQFIKKPGRILLLVGPQDCGKSAILQKVADDVGRDQIIMLDLRSSEISSPLGFLRALQGALATSFGDSSFLASWKKAWEGISGRLKLETPAVARFKAEFEGEKTFQQVHVDVQTVIRDVLKQRAATGQPPPTLVIDEANVLQRWLSHKEYREILSSYMRFFILITKQTRLANVILVSSDFLFKFWLNEEIRATRYIAHVIGDFPEAEARGFFEHILGRECSDETWNAVYNVYGGSANLLIMAAESLELSDDAWKEEAVQFYLQVMSEVEMGLSPECLNPKAVPACWTRELYFLILSTMAEYPNGVTPWKLLCRLVGQEVLKALICYNLVQYRTNSTLARDLTWYKGSTPVVMPLSRLHWLAMLELVQREKGILRDEEIDFQHVATLESSQKTLILLGPDEEQSK